MVLLFSWCLLFALARAQTTCYWPQYPNDRFLFPPSRCNNGNYTGINVYQLGTKLTITWLTSQQYVHLYIYQEWGGASALQPLLTNTTAKSYDWTGYPPQRLALSNTFFFALYKVGETAALAASDYFNVTDPNAKTSTTAIPATSATSGITSVVPATQSPTQGSSSSDSTAPANTAGRDIGIGVGVGLGTALILVAVAVWFCIYRPKRKARELIASQHQTQGYYDQESASRFAHSTPSELHSTPSAQAAKQYYAQPAVYTELPAHPEPYR